MFEQGKKESMNKERLKRERKASAKKAKRQESICYRLKCQKTANGLSHFVMYGDVPKEKSLV